MTAPTLKTYPDYRNRQRNYPNNTGVVASFTPGKGWQASGYGLPIPTALSEVIEVVQN